MKVTLHPGAEQDMLDAAEFYELEASPRLAGRFIAEFKRVAALLLANPGIGSPRSNGRRSFSLQVFPYSVVYRSSVNGIEILILRHHRRRPSHGESRK